MLPVPWMPRPLPTNSRSSFASSTTREGCSLHRTRNWELSTLPGGHSWAAAGPSRPQTHGPPSRTRNRGGQDSLVRPLK